MSIEVMDAKAERKKKDLIKMRPKVKPTDRRRKRITEER